MQGALLALVLAAAPAARAAVEVRPEPDGRVSLRADAPASEILDRLGTQTGMRIVYEGGAPRARVNVAFEKRTQAEAVLMVLEGLGYDYLLRYDRSGTRAELLIVSGPSSSVTKPLPTAPASGAASRPSRPIEPDDEEEEPEDEVVEEEVAPSEPAKGQAGRPQAPSMRPAFGPNAAPNYPVSPFAPSSPGLPAVVVPPTPTPEGQEPVQPQADSADQ